MALWKYVSFNLKNLSQVFKHFSSFAKKKINKNFFKFRKTYQNTSNLGKFFKCDEFLQTFLIVHKELTYVHAYIHA